MCTKILMQNTLKQVKNWNRRTNRNEQEEVGASKIETFEGN